MTADDLFEAIGQVESTRLLDTEWGLSVCKEDKPMKKWTAGRIIRNLLAAALILSTISITAYAAVGYLIFDNPQQMISALFGDNTGYDHKGVTHWTDPEKPGSVYDNPAYDRVPVDESLAATEVAPHVDAVGQSLSWSGYTLTVDANLYDPATKCGVVTYTLENPAGLAEYYTQENGRLEFPEGDLLDANQYGYSYLIPDKTTDTRLTAAYYYQIRNPEEDFLTLTLSAYAADSLEEQDAKRDEIVGKIEARIRQEKSEEEVMDFLKNDYYKSEWAWFQKNYTREELLENGYEGLALCDEEYETLSQQYWDSVTCPDKITLTRDTQQQMKHITAAEGNIVLSPIAIYIDEFAESPAETGVGLAQVVLEFAQGEPYVVQDDAVPLDNSMFAVISENKEDLTLMFNRLVDIQSVTKVILDGVEFPVD